MFIKKIKWFDYFTLLTAFGCLAVGIEKLIKKDVWWENVIVFSLATIILLITFLKIRFRK